MPGAKLELKAQSLLSRMEGLFHGPAAASSHTTLESAPGSNTGGVLLWSQQWCQLIALHGYCHQGIGRLPRQVLIPKGQVRGLGWGGTGKELPHF